MLVKRVLITHCIVVPACNCSALAVTEECDQVTGACVCQDGARGLKCDDCEYGYIGIDNN